ncbi:MAG: hypothetical protein H6Q31_724 [Bacteroidetes bacterium]|nr:hypothetical protein [Bacteroidota bacterium]
MSTPVKGGLLLGILTVLWTFVLGFTGWYKDPVMLNMFWLVILIQLGVMIWALRKTGAEGAPYGKQILNGLILSVVGAVIIFFGSLLFTSVVFPNYFEELRAAHTEILRNSGQSEEEIARTLAGESSMQTPFGQAISGVMGTIATGLVFSLILGIFFRKKN